MKITSVAFDKEGIIPSKYTCHGENVNPPLEFHGIPEGTKSLVLIVDDPDANGGKPFVHWILYNLTPRIGFIKENSKPGVSSVGLNDFGKNEYGGPCPPSGVHHYFFRLYALNTILEEMPEFTDKDMLIEAMNSHVLEETYLVGIVEKH